MTVSRRSLDLHGDLELAGPGGVVRIRASGDEVVVDVPGLASMRGLFGGGLGRASRVRLLERIQAVLRHADVRVILRTDGRVIGRLDAGSEPTLVSRLLGLGPVEIRPLRGVRGTLPSF